jgi:hypothetical protein
MGLALIFGGSAAELNFFLQHLLYSWKLSRTVDIRKD